MEEETAHNVWKPFSKEHGQEHELVVEDEDEVSRFVRVGHHLEREGGREGGR